MPLVGIKSTLNLIDKSKLRSIVCLVNCGSNYVSNKCLLSYYYMQSTVLGASHTKISKTGMHPALIVLRVQWEKWK